MGFRAYLETETVKSVGFRPPVTVPPDATIAEAIEVLQRRRVGCVLVVSEKDGLTGIVTERDVLRKVLVRSGGASREEPVTSIMTPDPVTIRTDDVLGRLFRRMHEGGFRHIPLLDEEGRLLGTMSIKRVVRFLADQFPQTVYNLPPDPEKFGAAREGA